MAAKNLPPEALRLATATKEDRPMPPPPPKPTMPRSLATGEALDPRATEVDKDRLERMSARHPGIGAAMQTAAAAAQQQVASPVDEVPLSDEDAVGTMKPSEGPAKSAVEDTKPGDTGAEDPDAHLCPYCGYDQQKGKSDVPDCTPEDKLQYLVHLNGLDFVKEYSILNGHIKVQFRVLTVRELDAISHHVMQLMRDGKIALSEQEYGESYLRCRLYLQLRKLSGNPYEGGSVEFPMGLNKDTNPEAGSWHVGSKLDGGPEGENNVKPATLDDVTKFMLDKYIKNEGMQRMLLQTLREFNRLMGYMETNAPHASFWKGIQ